MDVDGNRQKELRKSTKEIIRSISLYIKMACIVTRDTKIKFIINILSRAHFTNREVFIG